jgi:hypothetical protein
MRLRAAFVVTVSVAGTLACHRAQTSSCEPPDCHSNPPPPPQPPTPPPTPLVTNEAGAAPLVTVHRNPPPVLDGGLVP